MFALCRFKEIMRFCEYVMIFVLRFVNLLFVKSLSECIQIWTFFCFNVKFCTSSKTTQLFFSVVLSIKRRRDEKKSSKRQFERLVEWICIIIRLIRRKLTSNKLKLLKITWRSFMFWLTFFVINEKCLRCFWILTRIFSCARHVLIIFRSIMMMNSKMMMMMMMTTMITTTMITTKSRTRFKKTSTQISKKIKTMSMSNHLKKKKAESMND